MIRWARPSRLAAHGVLGMNRRNVDFIAPYNSRRLYPGVDDKLRTKELAREEGLAVPELYGVVRHQYEVNTLADLLKPHRQFVIKPCQGSAGKGILVVMDRRSSGYVKASGEEISFPEVRRHVNNILSGLYSLGGRLDRALIEYVVQFTDSFEGFSYKGVPDVRVVIFEGYPVMAMMRLSTRSSDGKANLHQGAVGVGIELMTGCANGAVQHNRPVLEHPDTGRRLSELQVPRWDELLRLAAKCYEMTGLGYFGADIVLDKEFGPLVLELNARPGLAIQIANGDGLLHRLQRIQNLGKARFKATPEERVAFSQKHFGLGN